MLRKFLIFSALLAYGGIACAAEVEPINMVYESGKPETKRVKASSRKKKQEEAPTARTPLNCNVEVLPVIDDRQNKVTLGSKFVKPLIPNGLDTWLGEAFKDLEKVGVKTGDAAKPTLRMQPYLTRLYANARGMNLHGTVAVRLEYYQGDKKLEVARARGYSSAANWANGDGEYVDVLNRAMHELFPEIKVSASRVCESL